MKLRNSVWYSDFYLSNGERVRKSLGTHEKAAAKRSEKEMQAVMEAALRGAQMASTVPLKASRGASVAPPVVVRGMTFRDAFKRARREYEPWRASTSPKTIDDNYKHVVGYFKEDTDLATLSRAGMFEYVEHLRDEKELSASTINQRLSLVSVLLTCAEDWTHRAVTVFKMPRQTVRNGRIRTLSYDEEFAVVKWFKESKRSRGHDKDMVALVPFLVDTGFRLSEALRVQTREVDWENGLVPAWETKADHPRLVPMTKRVRQILESREHLERPFEMFTVDSADDHWEKMREGLKINREKDPEFVIHALRHTCASRLVAEGMDAFRVQKWMGHKDIKTTMRYVTLFGKDLKDLARSLDRRRQEAAQKVPFGGPRSVPRLVPRSAPKMTPAEEIWVPGGLAESLVPQGFRPINEPKQPVDEGLLIRRSLVRAQVGEPLSSETSSEVDTNASAECVQDCDQK